VTTAPADKEELLIQLLAPAARGHAPRAIARDLLDSCGGLAGISRASPHELARRPGVGFARATRIAAAFELGRRAVACGIERETVTRPQDVFELVAPRLSGVQQEVFLVIGLDIRNQLLDVVEVGRGSVASVEVHPREIFRPMMRIAAAGIVLVHNHPSGDATPSPDDLELTERMRRVGTLVGIPIIDHVVIGGATFRSIAELGAS